MSKEVTRLERMVEIPTAAIPFLKSRIKTILSTIFNTPPTMRKSIGLLVSPMARRSEAPKL